MTASTVTSNGVSLLRVWTWAGSIAPIDLQRVAAAAAVGAAALAVPAPAWASASSEDAPAAGGAALGEVVLATAGAVVATAVLLLLGVGHRTGRTAVLSRLAAFGERVSGLPGWAAVPAGAIIFSLITALFGMLWDISLHIAEGRDEGPLANPAHYVILVGLFGVFTAGFLGMVLPRERPGPTAVRITGDWYAPLGAILIAACGAFSLVGFPLDDVWHRLFGQDVTLWGPTHLMLIGGAAMTLIGLAVLLAEAARANAATGGRRERNWVAFLRRVALTGAFLLGLSTFQAEFDFGVPQFRLVFQPMLIMLAAGASLVAARVWLGRGAALGAALFFIALRGLITIVVGPVLGEPTPYFPLYLAEAALVELVALRVPPTRPLAFGAWCGTLIGTVGLAAEWGWSHVWMPIPWPGDLLPEAALLGFAMAVTGSLIGGWMGARFAAETVPRTRSLRAAAALSALAVAALVGFALHKPADPGVTGRVALEEARGGAERTVHATVVLDPTGAAEEAEWLTATAWQGGGFLVEPLERVRRGVYRTTEPLPVHGTWKALIRLHVGNSLTALPVYLPEDPAIPAREIPARQRFTREFVADHELLQREQKQGVAGSLWAVAAYALVLGITLGFLALLAWGVHRIGVTTPSGPGKPPRPGVERAVGRPATTG